MNLFGANWKTSTGGYVETICIILIALCALPAEIWSNPRIWIPAVVLLVAKTVKDYFTKDKNVTGGMVQQTASGAAVDAGKQDLVDVTVKATVASGERDSVTPEQIRKANS